MINFSGYPYYFSFKMGFAALICSLIVLASLYYKIKPEHGYMLNKWQALKYSVLTFLLPVLALLACSLLLLPFTEAFEALPSMSATIIIIMLTLMCLLSPVILMVFKMRYNISSALMILLLTALSACITEYIMKLF